MAPDGHLVMSYLKDGETISRCLQDSGIMRNGSRGESE
jgi:hypothetical protein